jgi:hypothetical protein
LSIIEQNTPDGSFIKEIAALVPTPSTVHDLYRQQVLVIGTEQTVFDDPSMPEPKPLKVATLTAVAAYIHAELSDEKVVVNVISPTLVQIIAPIVGAMRQQFVYLSAAPVLPELSIGRYLGVEQFLIELQMGFIQTEIRDALQQFCSKLRTGLAKDIEDDGVTQTLTVQSGLTRTAGVPVANPWHLAPFRTFPEIEQPMSPFILRMKQQQVGESLTANAALLEADGGAWRATAIVAIGEWLREHLPEGTVVLA